MRKYGSSPVVAGSRFLGLLCGLGAMGLGAESALGVPFDPAIFPAAIGILAFIGLVGGMTALTIRRRAARALRLGVVEEAEGATEWGGPAGAGRLRVRVGTRNFAVPSRFATPYRGSTSLQLAWVSSGRRRTVPRFGSVEPVLLVSVNRVALVKPFESFLQA